METSIKNKHRVLRTVIVAFIILAIMGEKQFSYADEYISGPYVLIDSYRVDGDTIIPGKEFKLVVVIANLDEVKVAKDVVVSIAASSGIVPTYTAVPQVYVGDLKAGEKREIEFNCKAMDSLESEIVFFNVGIATDSRPNSVTIGVPVEGRKDQISVLSTSVPKEAYVGDAVSTGIRFKTMEGESYSEVTMTISVDGDTYDSYMIGNISAGATKTQNATLYFNESGEHDLRFLISCTDSKGNKSEVEAYTGKIKIHEKENSEIVSERERVVIEYSDREKIMMAGCIAGAVILAIAMIIVIRKHR